MSAINITFFCFQPIDIKITSINYLENTPSLNFAKNKGHPFGWINNFTQYNDAFKHKKIVCLNTPKLSTPPINSNDKTGQFDKYIKAIDAYLIITPTFSHVMLSLEIHLALPLNTIKNKHNDLNFYQQIRGMLVEDSTKTSEIRSWAKSIRQEAIEKTEQMLDITKGANSQARILPSTGNITCLAKTSDTEHKQLIQQLLEINTKAERLPGTVNKIDIQDGIFSFNGRFHTLVIKNNNENENYRYIPILYHMQFIWSQLRRLNSSLEDMSRFISNKQVKELKNHVDTANKLVNHSNYLKQIHESFKLSLERDNEDIYCKIQGRWNIENMLLNVCCYSDSLNTFIEKSYHRKNIAQQQKQNNSLLLIGVLQIIALISVWADYLQINTKPTIETTKHFLLSWRRLFELSIIELIHISLLPMGLLTVLLLMLSFKRHKN